MVEIIDETQQCPQPDLITEVLNRLLDERLSPDHSHIVTLIICDDETIKTLNKAHRNEDAPTDVLSYPTHEPSDVRMPVVEQLGDVFISLDTAKRQAVTHKHSATEELLVLAAHGITHLEGYDHETEEAWQTFHNAQTRVLELYQEKLLANPDL